MADDLYTVVDPAAEDSAEDGLEDILGDAGDPNDEDLLAIRERDLEGGVDGDTVFAEERESATDDMFSEPKGLRHSDPGAVDDNDQVWETDEMEDSEPENLAELGFHTVDADDDLRGPALDEDDDF